MERKSRTQAARELTAGIVATFLLSGGVGLYKNFDGPEQPEQRVQEWHFPAVD